VGRTVAGIPGAAVADKALVIVLAVVAPAGVRLVAPVREVADIVPLALVRTSGAAIIPGDTLNAAVVVAAAGVGSVAGVPVGTGVVARAGVEIAVVSGAGVAGRAGVREIAVVIHVAQIAVARVLEDMAGIRFHAMVVPGARVAPASSA
jgi:hypothetical protein